MANHFRLYSRPLMADEVPPVMTVTGLLEGYTAGEAYESRLAINNSTGRCTVEVLASTLPAGAIIRVDNITKQVVVKWKAYVAVSGEALVPNGGFESGDDGTWYKGGSNNGEGWSVGTGTAFDTQAGAHSARFVGVKTAASDLLSPIIPAALGDSIRLVGQVQQGASSKGNAGAMVALIYKDIEGNTLLRKDGNMVSSGSSGNWNPSVAEAIAPTNTSGVQIAITGFRKSENKPLWVDSLTWNHSYTLGQNSDELYFLSIKVTDAENRVAYWRGTIEELGIFLTSNLYPFYMSEELVTVPAFVAWRTSFSPSDTESILGTPSFVSFSARDILREYNAGYESVLSTASFVSIAIQSIRRDYDAGFEAVQSTPSMHSFTIKAHPVLELEVSSIQSTPAIVSWS